ncbi:MAG: bifunctional hydroxymethylpyrimidine kinase/phosphomethylpyrimidine kinase, partial [Niameybacter sp.]
RQIVLKGVPYEQGQKVNVIYDQSTNEFGIIPYEEIPQNYPGTGDCFTSRLIGALLQQVTLLDATKQATSFVTLGVKATYEAGTDTREGILLENLLDF